MDVPLRFRPGDLRGRDSWRLAWNAGLIGVAVLASLFSFTACAGRRTTPADDAALQPLLVGVLGDSDSHSYHDRILLTGDVRGGDEYRDTTYQWTEILERLRGDQVDLGAWGVWGGRRRYTLLRRLVGLPGRSPRKEDFEYNFALSGATCDALTEGITQQVRPLADVMKRDPASWQRGLVVMRIGINSLGQPEQIEEYARSGLSPSAREAVDRCVAHIRESVRRLREVQPRVGIALVGLADDLNWVPLVGRWQSAGEVRGVRAVLDYFDGELQQLADEHEHSVFVDDRAWWTRYWGDRDARGVPDYRAVNLGGRESVGNTQGDDPRNAVLEDGHGSTVLNGLWARHLLERVDDVLGLGISPLLYAEIADLADPTGESGLAPPDRPTGDPVLSLPMSSIDLSYRDLPWTVPLQQAEDSTGADISATAVAWLEDVEDGAPAWLHGSGRNLQVRRERFSAGVYRLQLVVRDRQGRVARTSINVTITPEDAAPGSGEGPEVRPRPSSDR